MVEGELPLPVRIPIHPHHHFAVWGWLTLNSGDGRMAIDIVSGGTTQRFFDHAEMVQRMTPHFPNLDAQMSDVNVRNSVNGISVRMSETRYVPLSIDTADIIQIGAAGEMPPSIARVQCLASAPRSVDAATTSPKRAPKRPRKTASKQSPPPPPRSPMRTDDGDSYDIATIGGDKYEMQRIALNCPSWDSEIILYVIENGGRPPLIDISGRTNMDMFCTFRAPNGDVVHNVRVPKSVVAVLYGRE